MKKTITIGDKEIQLKTNGLTPLLYKNEFHRDFFLDYANLIDKGNMDLEYILNLAWLYARTADETVPDRDTWLESFDDFPAVDVMEDIIEITTRALTTSNSKNSNGKGKAKANH